MKRISVKEAKVFQKHAVFLIEFMIEKMRYDKKTELRILNIMEKARDNIKSKKFIESLTKHSSQRGKEE